MKSSGSVSDSTGALILSSSADHGTGACPWLKDWQMSGCASPEVGNGASMCNLRLALLADGSFSAVALGIACPSLSSL